MTLINTLMAGAILLQPATTTPPCQTEEYRQFDFWLGEWEVFSPDGTKQGENSITSEENGCLIVERWTSAQGTTGQSYNYYNPHTEKWQQLWVSGGIIVDYAGGLNEEGQMVLEGEITYRANSSSTFPFTGTWTANDDGTTTQHFEQYNPQTEEWDDWFTGHYRPKAD